MTEKELINKFRNGELDCNGQSLFFSILIKGLIYNLNGALKVRDIPVPHFILHTGNEYMYQEIKGQDINQDMYGVSNEDYIYNTVPRCIVTPAGIDILADQLTNPYTRGTFQYETDENIYSLSAEFRRMPLTLSVNLDYYTDSFTDMLELMQQILTKVAFTRTFVISYMGQNITSSFTLEGGMEDEHLMEMDGTLSDSRCHKLSASFQVETNMPIFDGRTIVSNGSVITNLGRPQVKAPQYINGTPTNLLYPNPIKPIERGSTNEVSSESSIASKSDRQGTYSNSPYTEEQMNWSEEPEPVKNPLQGEISVIKKDDSKHLIHKTDTYNRPTKKQQ